MFISILLLVLGFVMLVKGADWFVDGASGIAQKLKVPDLIIGLTVVAFGTSAPELAVSVSSSLAGEAGLTIGNVLGSNILNILLILGISAVFTALPVGKSLRTIDIPFLLFVSLLFSAFILFDQTLDTWEGILSVVLLLAYTAFLVITSLQARKKGLQVELPAEEGEEPSSALGKWYEKMKGKVWFLIVILLVGLALVVEGANIAVDAASDIATRLGVSERIIGLTVVAIGTSLPELVTSVTAAIKGKTDIAVGNIVGSNVFNILLVAGVAACISPITVPDFTVDALVALGAAVLLAVLGYIKGNKIRRWGGIVMLVALTGYFVYLFVS